MAPYQVREDHTALALMNRNCQQDYQQKPRHVVLMVGHKELAAEDLPLQVCEVGLERVREMMVQESPVFLALAFLRLVQ